jgi:hypothetical protein
MHLTPMGHELVADRVVQYLEHHQLPATHRCGDGRWTQ